MQLLRALFKQLILFYFFGKAECAEIFQVRRDIMPEVNRLIGKHLFSSVGSNIWFAEVLI